MPDDWSWFWASEYGRDRMLRNEVEGLASQASQASAQSARLSSQLRTLQGSIESRLQALSTAFDAYVELGDVREQLAGYPDTGAVRRDTLRALDALGQNGVPDPVDGRGVDYWLVGAINEVIAVAGASAGSPPAATGGTGATPEHETFVVAALGWLGRGERVSDRVVPLLLGDGALAAPQVVLWQAVVHGLYGDVMTAVHDRWRADLDLAAPTWDTFARDTARAAAPVDTLRWVQDVLRGSWVPARPVDAGPPTNDRFALRALVDALVGAGLGDERTLLDRARVLRARIEDPGGREPDPDAEPPRTATTDLVQRALLDPDVGAGIRAALVGWVQPGLQAAAAEIAAGVAAEQVPPTVVRTENGNVDVGVDGADPGRLAQLDALAQQRFTTSRARVLVPAGSGVVVLVVALVLLPTQVGGLGVVLILVAAVLGVVALRALLAARSARAELAASRERTQQRVVDGRQIAASVRSANLETKAEVASLARAIADVSAVTAGGLR